MSEPPLPNPAPPSEPTFHSNAPSDAVTEAATRSMYRYSRKGLSATEKLAKQLKFAVNDPLGTSSCSSLPFDIITNAPAALPVLPAPFTFSVAQHIGSKMIQEDGFLPLSVVPFSWKGTMQEGHLFAIFDGHGDRGEVSHYLRIALTPTFQEVLRELDLQSPLIEKPNDQTITDTWTQTCHLLHQRYVGNIGGATLLGVFRLGNQIFFPNVGDCRALLVKKNGSIYQLTEDAAAEKERFQRWHKKQGNLVGQTLDGTWRISHKLPLMLNVARDIGSFKWMCPTPKITSISQSLEPCDLNQSRIHYEPGDVIVAGSDGLFAEGTTEEVGTLVLKLLRAGMSHDEITTRLAHLAGSRIDSDNVTVSIFTL